MSDNDLKNLDNQELTELLATLEEMDTFLEEQEKKLNDEGDLNE